MSDLDGVCVDLAWLDRSSLTPLDVARLGALQSGAFMFAAAQSKFDPAKSGNCAVCNCPDTPHHRVCECPLFAEGMGLCKMNYAAQMHDTPSFGPFEPLCAAVERNAGKLARSGQRFQTHCLQQQLFTDGSCLWRDVSDLSVAAWAVVCATADCAAACGQLPGPAQTTPRAELAAVLAACLWVAEVKVETTIWCDAQYVCLSFQRLLEGRAVPSHWNNLDLWLSVHEVLETLPEGMVRIPQANLPLKSGCRFGTRGQMFKQSPLL